MRHVLRSLVLVALAALAALPAHAQRRPAAAGKVDPCTGRPVVDESAPVVPPAPPVAPLTPPEPPPLITPPEPSPPIAAPPVAACPPWGAGDSPRAEQTRRLLALDVSEGAQVRLGPAASVSVPTAYGVEGGELFVGAAYQGRTRYTEEDDAAAVAGVGIGTRRIVALEIALTSYSTFRGGPLETGGLSFKLHRALPRSTSVAVGWENAVLWGGSDDRGSLYAAATRQVELRADPAAPFSTAVLTLGVGNGRFRFESDDADGRETVNAFAAAGLRINDPVSLVADWTGQDLNAAVSVTPIRRLPLVVTVGAADLTGRAGDGARLLVSLGYGLAFRQPFP